MIASVLLGLVGLAFLLWLIFDLAVYALPFYAGCPRLSSPGITRLA